MESEEVLASIMSKLKEYKGNPLSSPVEEKERQKKLMKMFCIYTSLKKREEARQKKEKHNTTIYEVEKGKNSLILDNCDQNTEIENINSCESDRISLNNSAENDAGDEKESEAETLMEYQSDEHEFCSDFSPVNQECQKDYSSERELDETDKSFDEEDQEKALNQFLIKLSERLKRLPYRQRSKLEIEFFRRLLEVEEILESYNN